MELLYNIGLTLLEGVGDKIGKVLYETCGSAEAVFKEKKRNLLKIREIGEVLAHNIQSQTVLKRAEEELRFIEKQAITPLFFTQEDYPRRLLHCDSHPLMLYYKGTANLNVDKVVSIVGTRRSTDYGKVICEQLVQAFVEDKVLIVSGLAYGIDTHAHRFSVEQGTPTVGVLGHGLDRLYPTQNIQLAQKMVQNGGLLTDFLSSTNPDAVNFPSRNRIIAGMSDATIVVEAAKRGGALITAEYANSYNRDVFAVPGRLGDTTSEGCNALIKTNKATLLQTAEDVRYLLNWNHAVVSTQQIQRQLFLSLSDDQQVVFNVLNSCDKRYIDELCAQSQMPLSKVSVVLLELELAGIIECLPGKLYRVKN